MTSPRRSMRCAARGLTLLEVIVAVSLMVMLLGAMLTFFFQTMKIRDAARENSERTQIARQVLSRIEAELRGTIGSDEIGFPVAARLLGDRRSITFLTSALPGESQYQIYSELDEPPPAQHDLTQLTYELWVDPQETDPNTGEPIVGGIIRTEKKTLNQFVVDEGDPLDVRTDLWSAELGYLEFRYFDGVEWSTDWNVARGNSLPQAVQVIVGYLPVTQEELDDSDLDTYPISDFPFGAPEVHADRYSIVVRIPAADRLFGSRIQRVGNQLSDQLGVEGVQ